jgi:ABC-2 type transport system permease protein
LPLTWFIKVARGVMVRGAPIDALWLPLAILAVMAVVVFTASTLRVRRDLAPAGRRDDEGAAGAGEPGGSGGKAATGAAG